MFTSFGLISVLGAVASVSSFTTSDVFDRTKECSLSSQDFTKCIKASIQNVISNFINEEVDDDEKMDPLLLPEMPFSYGPLPTEMMGLELSGVALHGLSRTNIIGVRANVKDTSALRLEVDIRNPLLYIEGNYSAHMSREGEAINSQGAFNVTIFDIKGSLLLKGHTKSRNNTEYLQIDRASFGPRFSDMKVSLTNENDPYPEMTTMVVSLINGYWRLVYSQALPLIEETMDQLIRAYVEEMVFDVPFYEIVSP